MDIKVIVNFYKEQIYVFGICPCCKEIFHLPDANLSVKTKKVLLSESKNIIELQNSNERLSNKSETLNYKLEDIKYNISELKLELKSKDTKEITKVKKQGRREAINASKRFIPVFNRKKYDPRDARLIFSPVEFLIFDGLTEYKEIDNLILLSKHPETSEQEKIANSIISTIKKGNIDFQLIRFNKRGKIEYE